MPKRQPVRDRVELELATARSKIRSRRTPQDGLSYYKTGSSVDELERVLPRLIAHPAYKRIFWPHPFPRKLEHLGARSLRGYYSFEKELTWLVHTVLPHAERIQEFLNERRRFGRTLLLSSEGLILDHLNRMEESFGHSLWLTAARINFLRSFVEWETEREFADSIIKNRTIEPGSRFIVSYLDLRCEPSMTPSDFASLIGASVSSKVSDVNIAARVALGDVPVINADSWAAIIAFGDMFQVIDRYLFIIKAIQVILATKVEELFEATERALRPLVRTMDDTSLGKLYGSLNHSIPSRVDIQELQPLSLYMTGQFEQAISAAAPFAKEGSIRHLHTAILSTHMIGSDYRSFVSNEETLMTAIGGDLQRIVANSPDSPDAVQRIEKIAMDHCDQPWAHDLQLILSRRSHDERITPPLPRQVYSAIGVPYNAPALALLLDRDAAPAYVESFGDDCRTTAEYEIVRALVCDEMPPAISPSVIPALLSEVKAAVQLKRGNASDAAKELRIGLDAARPADRVSGRRILTECYLQSNELLGAASECVSLATEVPSLIKVLPLERIVDRIVASAQSAKQFDPQTFGQLPIVILFDMYSRNVAPTRDAERSDAF